MQAQATAGEQALTERLEVRMPARLLRDVRLAALAHGLPVSAYVRQVLARAAKETTCRSTT